MRSWFLVVILLLVFFSCKKKYNANSKAIDLIPKSSEVVFKINAINDFKNTINENKFIAGLVLNEKKQILNLLQLLNPINEVLITTQGDSLNTIFSIITKNDKQLFLKDSTHIFTPEETKTKDISKYIISGDTLYYKIIDSLFFGSNNLKFLKAIKNNKNETELKRLVAIGDKNKTASVLFKNDSKLSDILFFDTFKNENISEFSVLDFSFKNNGIQYNGITRGQDSLFLINSFKNTIPQSLKIVEILPENTSSFQRISYDDYSVFSNNISTILKKSNDSLPSILDYTSEVVEFKIDTKKAVALYTFNTDPLSQILTLNTSVDIYRDLNIYEFKNDTLFSTKLAPFINFSAAKYFFILDSFVVFSDNIETLKTIISAKLNNKTIDKFDPFKSILNDVSKESSIFIYKNNEELGKFLGETTYNTSALQFTYDTNFAHVNASLKTHKTAAPKNSVTEYFSLTLPSDLVILPQTVKNHTNNSQSIVVQDIDNILYYISDLGKILWKRKLNGKILGDIQQVDTFKNGRLQLVFATENEVYIIDRNGKDVGKFPIKFNDNITQPLSVFDYDNTKNYRLLVTQNKSLLMYDVNGKKVNGFKYKSSNKVISAQPKHFRISGKDYIVFSEGESLKIIDRRGNNRIIVTDNIRFSENEIYNYKNKFTTTNTLGELVQVDTKGKVARQSLNLLYTHSIAALSKTLVTLTDNKLKIRNKTIDLDYGNYTAPKIFNIDDKIYVTVTDLQTKKVYLFDSQAKPISNFPVFGVSSAKLVQLDKNKGIELLVQTDSKTITVYKLN